MEAILNVLTTAEYDVERIALGALLLLLLAILAFSVAHVRSKTQAGVATRLRPLKAYETLKVTMGRAVETGRPLHISLGTGGVGDTTTAESLAALTMLDQLVETEVTFGIEPLVTTGDPTLMIAAQDRARLAHARRGAPAGYSSTQVRLVAPDPTAYAAGVLEILQHERPGGNVMLGAFGDEYLLMGEVGARQDPSQVAGAADPSVLPFVVATSDAPLLGEEIFTAGAYLGELPAHIGSLLAQDWVRIVLILVILVGVAVKSLT